MSVFEPENDHFLLSGFLGTTVLQLSCFFIAYSCKFDLITDFAGSTNFVILAIISLCVSGNYHPRQIILTSMLCVSRMELALFLFYRVIKRKGDARFDERREKFLVFLGFWIFQIFWVFLCTMPVFWVNTVKQNPDIQWMDVLGWIMWTFGFLIQVVSDFQKFAFRADSANKLKICDRGLWKYSRHPNYYGEMLIWWGMFVSTISVWVLPGQHSGFASILSPIFTMTILLFLSGIPEAEGSKLKRYYTSGDEVKEAYETYRNQTAPIILFPNSLYTLLPSWVQWCCCCEFEMYKYKSGESERLTDTREQTEVVVHQP
eukprot:m.263196 g.263196  ORF g.263196 m.263196 type:complete len:317 (+) comp49280_c0_seq1:173-1123(+)